MASQNAPVTAGLDHCQHERIISTPSKPLATFVLESSAPFIFYEMKKYSPPSMVKVELCACLISVTYLLVWEKEYEHVIS